MEYKMSGKCKESYCGKENKERRFGTEESGRAEIGNCEKQS
jgi:hypothetical protein